MTTSTTMTNPTPTPPLWMAMYEAYDESEAPQGGDWRDEHGYAAEIRAVANAIHNEWSDSSLAEIGTVVMISDWLRAEAERAEAGE